MIYECPQCQTPQEAGQTVCPHCHAQFDGPVPDDAIVPKAAPAPEAIAAVTADPVTEPGIVEEVHPPAEATPTAGPGSQSSFPPPPLSQPALSPPTPFPYAPPYAPQNDVPPAQMRPPLSGLSKALLFAFPIVIVLILGGIYFASTLNTGADTASAPTPPTIVQPAISTASPPVPVGSPLLLQGGGNRTLDASDPRVKKLAGHWEAKSGDFYVFNSDGTGSRGSTTGKQKDQSFLWGLVQNRLMLYMDKNEMLRFNPGPDDDTIYLGEQSGHYVQLSRKTSV